MLEICLMIGPIAIKDAQGWYNISLFEDQVAHRQPIENLNTNDGYLTGKPFEIPADLPMESITGAAIIDPSTGDVKLEYGLQVPARGIYDFCGNQTFIFEGWAEHHVEEETYTSDCRALLADPCALLEELLCCELRLIKDEQCVDIDLGDHRLRLQPATDGHFALLARKIGEAREACEKQKKGACYTNRGGRMRHTCN